MNTKRFCYLAGVVVASAGILAATTWPALAGQPELVERTFGFYATGSLVGPDFTSEDSKVVTALPNAASPVSGAMLHFSTTEENPAWLRGTHWIAAPAHHATTPDNDFGGVFFWLSTGECPVPPPVGAHTLTGPDGMIVEQIRYRIARCNGDCNPLEGDEFFRVSPGEGQGTAFVVVTALFSR